MAQVSSSTLCRVTAKTSRVRSEAASSNRVAMSLSSRKGFGTSVANFVAKSNAKNLGRRSLVVRADDDDEAPSPMMIAPFQSALNSLLSQRIVRLGGEVNDEIANSIVAQFLYLDAMDPEKDITFYINSPGGSVTAGMAIFDTMRHIRPDVSTVCVGMAASMGAFLLASGKKGKRYALPNARIMIHQPLGGAQGQATDIELQAMEMMYHKETLNTFLAEFTGKTLAEMKKDTDRDFFLSSDESVEYGVIDAVVQNERWNKVSQLKMEEYDFLGHDWRELPTLDPMNPLNINTLNAEEEEKKKAEEQAKQ